MNYQAPRIADLGSVLDLTQQNFNKIGPKSDALSPNPLGIVGSVVPVRP